MFSYIDATIRQRLESSGKLVYLNRDAQRVPRTFEGAPVLSLLGPIPLPLQVRGRELLFHWYPFVRRIELQKVLDAAAAVTPRSHHTLHALLQEHMSVNSVLATPNLDTVDTPLVRVHSCCMTGDAFGSMRCECGPQLHEALDQVAARGGAVVYMSSHEGRGIGLWAKAITYLLQDEGQDTYQANTSLGLPEDSRDFDDAAVVLRYLLGDRPIVLLTNNPLKVAHLERMGQKIQRTQRIQVGVCDHNLRYLRAKRDKGHDIDV